VLISTSTFVIFRGFGDRMHFLGDGGRTILDASPPARAHLSELLPGFLQAMAVALSRSFGLTAERALEALSCLLGVPFVLLVLHHAPRLASVSHHRVLLAAMILTGGGMQLYFGYVESYPLLHLFVLAYMLVALSALSAATAGRRFSPPRFLLNVLFVLLPATHLSALALLPAHAYLLRRLAGTSARRAIVPIVLELGAAILLVGAPLAACAELAGVKMERLSTGSSILLPLSGPYSLFSPAHVLDLVNELALILPAGLPLAVVGGRTLIRGLGGRRDAAFRFLLLAAVGTSLFAATIDPVLGMARDWDLVAVFWLPAILLLILGVIQSPRLSSRDVSLLVVCAGLCTAPWMALNHHPEVAMRRFRDLLAMDADRPGAAYGYEMLATYLREAGDLQGSVAAFEQAVELRGSSVRLQEQLAHAQRGLARRLLQQRQYGPAADVLRTMLDSGATQTAENRFLIGVALLGQGHCAPAIEELQAALAQGWEDDDILFHLGFAQRSCGQAVESRATFRRYLAAHPHGGYADLAMRYLLEPG
jgi:hypothetical protein